MKKSHFSNQGYYTTLIVIICVLIIWNLYAILVSVNFIGLIPITVQGIILILIITKNQYAKLALKIWAIVFLIASSGLQIIGQLLQDAAYDFRDSVPLNYLIIGIPLTLGIWILTSAIKTINVIE